MRALTFLVPFVLACTDKVTDDSTAPPDSSTDSDSAPSDDSAPDSEPPPQDLDADGYTDDVDCDDENAAIYPGAAELCDEIDQDCDGDVDEEATDMQTWYADLDGDSFGDASSAVTACEVPAEHVRDDTDCDDANADVHPDATEVCDDGVDQDCDGGSGSCAWSGDLDITAIGVAIEGEAGEELAGAGAGLGDVDGDGLADLGLGAAAADVGGTNAGAARVVFGPVLDAGSLRGVRLEGPAAGDKVGTSMAGPGDVDGDGLADLLIGAPGDDTAGSGAGAAWLVAGPPLDGTLGTDQGVRLLGGAAGDGAGAAVGAPGDLDGDGDAELLVGASGGAGAWALFQGPVTGTLTWAEASLSATGAVSGDALGAAVDGVGDLDGDGVQDIAVGAPGDDTDASNAGAVTLLYMADATSAHTEVSWRGHDGALAGSAVARVGDANADGYADVLVGIPYDDTVADFAGSAALLLGPATAGGPLTGADALLLGAESGDTTGVSVRGPGDVNGDGLDDLLVGAPWADVIANNGGAGCLVYSPASGTISLDGGSTRFGGADTYVRAGQSLAAVGDLSGDGIADLLIGSPYVTTTGASGGVGWVIQGHGL